MPRDLAADWEAATPVKRDLAAEWEAADPKKAAAPGVFRRLLGPFKGMEPIIAANKAQADQSGPPVINRLFGYSEENEPDVLTGAKRFVRGMPGFDPTSTGTAADQRVARFNEDHPIMAPALGMAGGLAQPAMLPMVGKAAAESAPAIAEAAAPAAAQAAAPVAQAAERAAPAAVNAYEAAGRGVKVQELVKAIEANAVTHLGVDPRAPQFAEALSSLPEQWWEGMAQFARVNKPSQATIDDAINFFRDRAAQTAKAAAAVPEAAAAAPAAVQAAAPAAAPAPAAQAGPLWAIVRKLQSMPKREGMDMLDLLVGGAGVHHGGTIEGLATAAGSRLLRNYGPPVAAAAISKVAGAPGLAAGTAANMLRGAGSRDSEVSAERDAASSVTQTVQAGEAAPDDADQAPSSLFWYLDPDADKSAIQLARAKAIREGAQKAPATGSTSIRTGAGPVSWAAPNKPWRRRGR